MQEYSATKIQEKLVAYSDKRPFMKIMGMHFWGVYCHNWAPDCVCVCGGDGTVKQQTFSIAICLEWRCKCMSVCGMSLCGLMCVSVCVLTFQTLYILLETLVVTFHVDVMLHHSEIRRLPNSRLCHEREGVGGGEIVQISESATSLCQNKTWNKTSIYFRYRIHIKYKHTCMHTDVQ